MLDVFLYIALGLLTIAMTVLGAITSTQDQKLKIWSVALGLASLIVVIVVGIRSDRKEKRAENEQRELRSKIDDMAGRQDVLIGFVMHPPEPPVLRELANHLAVLRSKPLVPSENPKPIETQQPSELTNRQIFDGVISLAQNMRNYEHTFKVGERDRLLGEFNSGVQNQDAPESKAAKEQRWRQETQELLARNEKYQTEFRNRFLGQAVYYRDELLRQLNIAPPAEERRVSALQGIFAGPYPLAELANYLERLARQLPLK